MTLKGRQELQGSIVGAVVVDTVSRSALPGRTALRILGPLIVLLAVAVAGYVVVTSAVHAATVLIPRLIVALIPVVFLFLILRFAMTGRVAMSRTGSRNRSRGPSLVGGVLRSGGRAVGGAMSGSSRAGSGLADATAEVHRFRIDTVSAGRVDCQMIGELRGPALRQGDWVTVMGRITRRRVLLARHVEVHSTGGIITARAPISFHLARIGSIAAVAVLALAVAMIVYR